MPARDRSARQAAIKPEALTDRLLETLPPLPPHIHLSMEQICSIDSNEVDDQLWLSLVRRINELASTDIDGFVITHGTDIMDETAYFLNLTVKTEKTGDSDRRNAPFNRRQCRRPAEPVPGNSPGLQAGSRRQGRAGVLLRQYLFRARCAEG